MVDYYYTCEGVPHVGSHVLGLDGGQEGGPHGGPPVAAAHGHLGLDVGGRGAGALQTPRPCPPGGGGFEARGNGWHHVCERGGRGE